MRRRYRLSTRQVVPRVTIGPVVYEADLLYDFLRGSCVTWIVYCEVCGVRDRNIISQEIAETAARFHRVQHSLQ